MRGSLPSMLLVDSAFPNGSPLKLRNAIRRPSGETFGSDVPPVLIAIRSLGAEEATEDMASALIALELRGAGSVETARAVEEAALALAIEPLLERTTDSLSGGELQRVALGAALVTGPPLLLLDEPTSQLDPVAGDELIALLRRLNEEWGVTVLLGEHRLERCLAAADRVVALDARRGDLRRRPGGLRPRIAPPRPGAGDPGDAAVRPRRDRSRARSRSSRRGRCSGSCRLR